MIQFGFAMAQKSALSSGARDGARIGSVNLLGSHTCSDIVTRVREGASTIGLGPDQVAVRVERLDGAAVVSRCAAAAGGTVSSPTTTPCTDGVETSRLRVVAEAEREIVVPPFFSSGEFTMDGTGIYRCEYR